MAVFGITTVRTSSPLNQLMLASFAANPTDRLLLRLVVFEDEATSADKEAGNWVAVLPRPDYLPWPHLQCTQKILQWLRHASRAFPHVQIIGQMDSDTWIQPQRLATYLASVATAVPPSALFWGGLFEHWQRLDTNGTIDCVGFSMDSPGAVSHWRETNKWYLRRSEAERRADSFAMAQGGFYFYSRGAAKRLLEFVLSPDRASNGGDGLLQQLATPPRHDNRGKQRRSGQYKSPPDPCDAILGWIGARAFEGMPLHAVSASLNLEYYPFPIFTRFNTAHGLVVHGVKAGARVDATIDWYRWRVGNATTPPPPQITCRPTRWLHSRSSKWSLCHNVAPCSDPGDTLISNASVPWLPAAVRDVCKGQRLQAEGGG